MLTETTSPGSERELRTYTRHFASTPRSARLARRLAGHWMEDWGYPSASDVGGTVALVVGELVANAVRHASVPGRRFGLSLTLDTTADLVRVEVADAATTKRLPTTTPSSHPEGESGRGLLLVDALAACWGWLPRDPVGKTVWADIPLEPSEPV